MSKDEYEKIILEKHKDKLYLYEQIYNDANFDIIDIKRVEWFIKEAKRQRHLDIVETSPAQDTLESLKYIKNNQLTNATHTRSVSKCFCS